MEPTKPLKVRISGFAAGSFVEVSLAGRVLGRTPVRRSGGGVLRAKVPFGVASGRRMLVARDVASGARVSVPVTVHTNWPMAGGSARGTYASVSEVAVNPGNVGSLHSIWQRPATYGEQYSEPVVDGGVVIVGHTAHLPDDENESGWVTAHDSTTGEAIGGAGGLDPVRVPPLPIGDDVWIVTDTGVIWVYKKGAPWEFRFNLRESDTGVGNAPAAPILAGGRIIVGGSASTVAIDPVTATVTWRAPGRSTPITSAGNLVFFDGQARDLNTGELRWQVPTPAGGGRLTAFTPAGTSVVGSWSDGRLVAYDQISGKVIWQHAADEGYGGGELTQFRNVLIAANGDETGRRRHQRGFDLTTGALLWTAGNVDPGHSHSIAVNGVLFSLSYTRALDDLEWVARDVVSGERLRAMTKDWAPGVGATAAAGDGRLYYGTRKELRAFSAG